MMAMGYYLSCRTKFQGKRHGLMDYSVPILTELVLVSADVERTLKISAQISPAQYQVLAALEGSSEPMTPSALARALALPASSIATILGKLKKIGSISISASPDDGRIRMISLSSVGTMVLLAADHSLDNLFQRIWRPLSSEQRSITQWGSASAMSGRRLIRVNKGSLDIGAAYGSAVLLSLRVLRSTLQKHKLSVNEYRVLKTALDVKPDGVDPCAADLGNVLVMSSSLLAQTTGALVKRALLESSVDSKDARIRRFAPTEKGREIMLAARRDVLRAMHKDVLPISRRALAQHGIIAEQINDVYRRSFKIS